MAGEYSVRISKEEYEILRLIYPASGVSLNIAIKNFAQSKQNMRFGAAWLLEYRRALNDYRKSHVTS